MQNVILARVTQWNRAGTFFYAIPVHLDGIVHNKVESILCWPIEYRMPFMKDYREVGFNKTGPLFPGTEEYIFLERRSEDPGKPEYRRCLIWGNALLYMNVVLRLSTFRFVRYDCRTYRADVKAGVLNDDGVEIVKIGIRSQDVIEEIFKGSPFRFAPHVHSQKEDSYHAGSGASRVHIVRKLKWQIMTKEGEWQDCMDPRQIADFKTLMSTILLKEIKKPAEEAKSPAKQQPSEIRELQVA